MEVAEELAGSADVQVVAVSFDAPERAAFWARDLDDRVRVLCDPERTLYARLGLGRASVARVWLHPRVWLAYARLMRRGARLARAGGDTRQLGGDAVLAADGSTAWIYRSRGPDDRPAPAEVAARARDARRLRR